MSMWPSQWIAIQAIAKITRKKVFRGFNGIRTRGLCVSSALPAELWRPIHWRLANLLSSSTRERNETLNVMMWTAGIQMKWVCDHRSESQFKQLRKQPEKKIFGASTGFEPVASALALQCSPSWAMKTHTLEAGQFIEFINPWKEWNTECNDVNCGNTNEMSTWPSQWIAIQTIAKISFHSVFHSFVHGLMNSINWPASSTWVFIAQLGEHCSANAKATGSNPVEAPKNFCSGYFRNCLNCDSLRWSHTHFALFNISHFRVYLPRLCFKWFFTENFTMLFKLICLWRFHT